MGWILAGGALIGASVLAVFLAVTRRKSAVGAEGIAVQTTSTTPVPRRRTPTPQPEIDASKLEESRHTLFRMIADVGASIQQLVRAAASYDADLAKHEQHLQQTTDLEEAKQICAEMLAELHDMREINSQYKQELAETQEKLRERESEIASMQLDLNTDYLTRILNRRGLEARVVEEIERAKRYDTPFSIAMFDIDLFKAVNDEHGHEAGDKVLRLVAHTLEELKRTNDSVGRFGGEEFMLLLPGATREQALAVADRARRQMERFVTRYQTSRIKVTMSGGVTQLDVESDTVQSLMARVDKGLYAAKERGRNQIEPV